MIYTHIYIYISLSLSLSPCVCVRIEGSPLDHASSQVFKIRQGIASLENEANLLTGKAGCLPGNGRFGGEAWHGLTIGTTYLQNFCKFMAFINANNMVSWRFTPGCGTILSSLAARIWRGNNCDLVPRQDKKKERAAKGKEVAELKGEQLLGWKERCRWNIMKPCREGTSRMWTMWTMWKLRALWEMVYIL